MTGRPHCRCDRSETFNYDQAAEELRCKPRFLQDRIKDLPHMKLGESVSFCRCEIELIRDKFGHVPAWVLELVNPAPAPALAAPVITPAVTALKSIRPAGRGRRQTASL